MNPRDSADTYTLFDELPDGVLVLDSTGRVKAANVAFLGMARRDEREVLGQCIEAIVAAEDMLQFLGAVAMFAEPMYDASIIFAASDGSPRRLLVCSAKSKDQQSILLTTRAAGAVQEELASTTRWAAAEQNRATELAEARDALAATNVALQAAQEEADRSYLRLKGEVAARERLEKDLRLAQKLESIGQLAAGIAHEINTPMQYVGDNVAFLARAFAKLSEHLQVAERAASGQTATSVEEANALLDASKVRCKLEYLLATVPRALKDSQAGIEHVTGIVRAMKSFAHVDQDESATGDINRALLDTLMVAQSEYKSVASIETDLGDLPPVVCFLGRLNQVFLNLIVNAAHAIAETHRAGGIIRVTSRVQGGVVVVSIGDNGAGIPERIQHQVFDQFFTTKPVGKGTGQGLSLARDIVVDAHGGTLSFETSAGLGTVFRVQLPVLGRSTAKLS